MSNDVELYIDTLVLRGFNPLHGERIRTFATEALRQLISEKGLSQGLTGNRQTDAVDAGRIQVSPTLPPRVVGEQIANAIFYGASHGK